MRFPAQRLERFFQRIQGGAREGQHLLAFIQQMQFVEAQGADNHNVAVIIVAVWRGAFGQTGIRRLHQNDFIGRNAGAEHPPQLQQASREYDGERVALA
ncbi:hypothetical protein D3C75_697850 [compost metagenome]